jgi:hypothetical protein
MKLTLLIQEIADKIIQENFQRVRNYLKDENPLEGFRVVTVTFKGPETRLVPHALGFQPSDAILLSKSGSGSVTFNFDAFSGENISVSSTGAVTIRALVGKAGTN